MAHQGEVVRDVSGAGAGVVVAELDIEAPVLPVLYLPVTAYGMGDLVRVWGQAADVVAPFDGGLAPCAASAFDHGEASDVAPLLGLVEPLADVDSTAQTATVSNSPSRCRVCCALRQSSSPSNTSTIVASFAVSIAHPKRQETTQIGQL